MFLLEPFAHHSERSEGRGAGVSRACPAEVPKGRRVITPQAEDRQAEPGR
jgi:hypothetical protein